MELEPKNPSLSVPDAITKLGHRYVTAYHQTLSENLSENSIQAYSNSMSQFGMFLINSPSVDYGISREMIIEYLVSRTSNNSSKRLSKRSASVNLTAIKKFLKMCHRNGIEIDPEIYDIFIPNPARPDTTPIQISHDEFRLLLSTIKINTNASFRDYVLTSAVFYGLLKNSEARSLRVEDFVSVDGKQVFLIKGNQCIHSRECPVILKNMILDYLNRTELADQKGAYLFPTSQGKSGNIYPYKKYGRSALWEMVKRRGKQAGLRTEICTPTAIRSGGISHLLSETGNLEFVRKRVGHSSADTTAFYNPII